MPLLQHRGRSVPGPKVIGIRGGNDDPYHQLSHTLAHRIGRYLERQGLLERDAKNSYLMGEDLESGPMAQLQGASITYRIAVGSQQGRKVFTLQTLPATEEAPCNPVAQNRSGGEIIGDILTIAHKPLRST